MRTKVCIIGGGPSGLLLSQLLHLNGIDNVLLEKHSREHVLARIRAGVLEHGFARLMDEAQCGERMQREGQVHHGFFIAHDGRLDRVDLNKYSGGGSVIVYGQTELTRDLYEARDRLGGIVMKPRTCSCTTWPAIDRVSLSARAARTSASNASS